MSDRAYAYGSLGATRATFESKPLVIEGWDHTSIRDDRWVHAARAEVVSASDRSLALRLFSGDTVEQPIALRIDLEGAAVAVDARIETPDSQPIATRLNRMGQSFTLPVDEHFFGLGERFDAIDRRGLRDECWVEEGGLGQGESQSVGPKNPSPNGRGMTGVPIPFFISTRGYGIWVESTTRTGFDFGSETSSAWRMYTTEPRLKYRIFIGDSPRAILAAFTLLTGRASLPAPWVFGPRRRVDHGKLIGGLDEAVALRNAHIATTVLDDTTHFLPIAAHLGREDELKTWNRKMHARGYKTIAYANPHISTANGAASELLAYGRAHDLFVKLDDGRELQSFIVSSGGQQVTTIDLSNAKAIAWYQSQLTGMFDVGYDGWMLDFGEYLPANARMKDGLSGLEAHNKFPFLMQQASFEAAKRARGNDFMFFVRSGSVGTAAVSSLVWSGDPSASFEEARGLPAQVRAGVTIGLSGVPFWGSNISGYTCVNDAPPDKEVYLRWAEFGALSSDMHDENACAGAAPNAPPKWTLWSDRETTDTYKMYASLHTRLFPYIYAAAREAVDTGLPVMRHPILVHPEVDEALAVEQEYYFGPALYVAPVVHRGERTRSLWLPPGEWVDWWTLNPQRGGQHTVRDAPLGIIPIFMRAGELVPMLDASIDTLATRTDRNIVAMADIDWLLDIRGLLTTKTPTATMTLADGTTLSAVLANGPPTIPAGYPPALTDADMMTCHRCARIDPLAGGAMRVRITSETKSDSPVTAGALSLRSTRVKQLRARWDIVVAM